jgi:hypothetical protein
MKTLTVLSSLLAFFPLRSTAFLAGDPSSGRPTHAAAAQHLPLGAPARSTSLLHASDDGLFEIELAVPPTSSRVIARLKFASVLSVPSEIVQVRYKLPFGLDVAPQNNLAVCTKDGAGGGM